MGPLKFTIIKKLKTNNRFNYTPRYYDGKEVIDNGKFPTKLDAYNETFNKNDYGSNWHQERLSRRNRGNVEFNKTVVVVALILALIFLWFIDFDLSIFTQAR